MTDTPTITFQCIGCPHSEEIELERASARIISYHYESWHVPDPWESDWHRNEDGQLVCQTCRETYLQEGPECSETLSAEERNPGLAGGPK